MYAFYIRNSNKTWESTLNKTIKDTSRQPLIKTSKHLSTRDALFTKKEARLRICRVHQTLFGRRVVVPAICMCLLALSFLPSNSIPPCRCDPLVCVVFFLGKNIATLCKPAIPVRRFAHSCMSMPLRDGFIRVSMG